MADENNSNGSNGQDGKNGGGRLNRVRSKVVAGVKEGTRQVPPGKTAACLRLAG